MNNKEFLGGILMGLILATFMGFLGWQLKPDTQPYTEPTIVVAGNQHIPISEVVQQIVNLIEASSKATE